MPTRRTLLFGLGSLLTGSGVLLGTSAFGRVRADRTVSVETAGDADALLAIEPGTGGEPYLTGDGQDGPLAIDLTAQEGVNENGITAIDRLLTVTNNGTHAVTIGFADDVAIEEGDYDSYGGPPGGWAYAGVPIEEPSAIVVLWASPFPDEMDKSLAEVRPGLTTTGFGDDSTLVDGRTIDDEVGEQSERTVGPGGRLSIGAIVDTRKSTIDARIPDALTESIAFLAARE